MLPDTEYITYDEFTKQWLLTKAAALRFAVIDMDEELKDEAYPEFQCDAILRQVSDLCYMYIHDFAMDTDFQDFVIANFEEARDVMFRAMLAQLKYMRENGDFTRSTDDKKREKYLDEAAKSFFNRPLACYRGKPLTYCGRMGW